MKKIISIIISILLFLSFLIFGVFTSIQQEFSLIDKVDALDFNLKDIEKYSNMSLEDLHKTFDKELKKQDLPTELLDYIVEDQNFNKVINDYKEEYVNYLKDKGEKPQIPTQKVNEIINRSITKYNKENTTNIKINNKKVENLTNDLSTKVDDVVNKIDDNPKITGFIKIIYNPIIQKVSFIVTTSLIILLVIINKSKSLKYISIPLLIDGLLFLLGTLILKRETLSIIQTILGTTYDNMVKILLNFGIYSIITSIILLIISLIINKKMKEV